MKRILSVICLLSIFSFGVIPGRAPTSGSQLTVLTTTAGPGISAQISNYSLTGNQFCFTITNTSTSVWITTIGFDLGAGLTASSFTQTGAGSFSLRNSPGLLAGPGSNPLSFALLANQSETKVATIANRIHPGMSTTFCVTASFAGFTPLQIAQSLVVIFERSLFEAGFVCGESFEQALLENASTIGVTFASESQFCFQVSNFSLSVDVITGVGFAVSNGDGTFTLESIDPLPQLGGQNLRFTTDPGPVPQFHNIDFVPEKPVPEFSTNLLDFAIVTSHNFAGGVLRKGIQPGETSSEFCVNGNFSDVSPVSPNFVFVRYPGEVLTCSEGVGGSLGGGLIGSRPT